MQGMTNRIHFIVALGCEAQPLIEHFRLQSDDPCALFKHFSSESMTLTVSGIGRINAACATVATYMRYPQPRQVWINIGIAGHASHARGNAYLIGKLQTGDKTRTWYPQILFKPPFAVAELTTVDQPTTEYTEQLHDMEAAGFYDLANRFSLLELIHCIKIVSDNRNNPADDLDKQFVSRLVRVKLDGIETCVNALRQLRNSLANGDNQDLLNAITVRSHFTTYQRHQLAKVLVRWQALVKDGTMPADIIDKPGNAEQILTLLNNFLDAQALDYGGFDPK